MVNLSFWGLVDCLEFRGCTGKVASLVDLAWKVTHEFMRECTLSSKHFDAIS